MSPQSTLTFGPTDADSGLPLVSLTQREDVFHLVMAGLPDNRFNPTMVDALNAALDHVENYAIPKEKGSRQRACALVTTSASPKFYSNGLDVMYLFQSGDTWFISDKYLALLKRILLFPCITVASINGHCFAGGLLFALCHDYRVLRSEKGLLSLNEIDLPSSLHPGMAAIARAKLPASTLHPLVFAAKRYGGQEALQAGLVDQVAPESELAEAAHTLAMAGAPKVKRAGRIVGELKFACYPDVVQALDIRAEIDVRAFMKPKM